MKKQLKALLFVIIIVFVGLAYYSKVYSVKNDKEVIKNRLIQFINRPTVVTNNIDIKQVIDIDNKKYVLFVIGGNLGDAELTRGINNKYKIESTGYGSSLFRYEIGKTNKDKYLILSGKNHNTEIAYAKVSLDNKEYNITIPKQEYFMVYCSVSDETERTFLQSNSIKFYSINNVDITNGIFKK